VTSEATHGSTPAPDSFGNPIDCRENTCDRKVKCRTRVAANRRDEPRTSDCSNSRSVERAAACLNAAGKRFARLTTCYLRETCGVGQRSMTVYAESSPGDSP
jgi:hypothetical protein